jgi:hypothetical protein
LILPTLGAGLVYDVSQFATNGIFTIITQPTTIPVLLNSYRLTGSGSWNTASNWSPATTPNSIGGIATLTSNITSSAAVTLDGNKTIGKVFIGDFDNNQTFTVTRGAGTGSLILNNGDYGQALISKIQAQDRADTISAPIVLNSNLRVNVNPGSNTGELNLSGPISDGANAFGVTTSGLGRVRLSGDTSNTYDGLTWVQQRGAGDAGNPNLVLGKTNGAIAVPGDLWIGSVSRGGSGLAVVQYSTAAGTTGEQIANGSVLHFDGAAANNPYLKMMGFEETVRGIVDFTREGVIENTEAFACVAHCMMSSACHVDRNPFRKSRA